MVIRQEPFACTYTQAEDRTPTVRLVANPNYWDRRRGPYLDEVVFRNDLTPDRALELVCTTEGEVDIVTEVRPADAARVGLSEYAKLVTIDAIRAIAGVINREAPGLPLNDPRARLALNLAVDRSALVRDVMFGHAVPLAGLTPPSAVSGWTAPKPHAHDPKRAARIWKEAGGTADRPIRLAYFGDLGGLTRRVAEDIAKALGVGTEVVGYPGEGEAEARRRLGEKREPQDWDVLILDHGSQSGDAPPLELHRAFAGVTGEFRAGPVVPEFDALYDGLVRQTTPTGQAAESARIEKFVYDEALALSLCAPEALYAVNRQVDFTPYRTTFELAGCRVGRGHWSRRGGR